MRKRVTIVSFCVAVILRVFTYVMIILSKARPATTSHLSVLRNTNEDLCYGN